MQRKDVESECSRDILDRAERTASEGGPYTVEEKKKQISHPKERGFGMTRFYFADELRGR